MITIVFGKPGSGKTAFLTANAVQYLNNSRRANDLYLDCLSQIEGMQSEGFAFSLPEHSPVYSNFRLLVPVGYDRYIGSYYIDGFHLGFENDNVDVISVLPDSKIFLSEAQRYYNSRKSKDLPDWVSRFFEEHRHYGLDIFLDVQRPGLIDVNIRELCECFVEVEKIEVRADKLGKVHETVFTVKMFSDWKFVEKYLATDDRCYSRQTLTYPYNVFESFQSKSYFRNFLPHTDFDYIDHVAIEDVEKDVELAKLMYRQTAPEGFYSEKRR